MMSEGKMEGQKDEMNVLSIQTERTESGKSQQEMRIFDEMQCPVAEHSSRVTEGFDDIIMYANIS